MENIPQEVVDAINLKLNGVDAISAEDVVEIKNSKQKNEASRISPYIFAASVYDSIYVAKKYLNGVKVIVI